MKETVYSESRLYSAFTSISSLVSHFAGFKLLCVAKHLRGSFVTEHKGNNSPLLKWEIQTYHPISNSCYNPIFA